MNGKIIAIIMGMIQIGLSINLIVRKKNGLAIVSEIISSLALLYIFNGYSIEINNNFWSNLFIATIEYVIVKLFLVIFMWIARYCSFYIIKQACRNNKKLKANSEKLKFVHAFNNAKYWPNEKLGHPGKANKAHPKTKVKFDSRGFPKFEFYYRVKLRRRDFRKTREQHFDIANEILYNAICSGTKLRVKFTRKQLEELKKGETPNGYVWHHHQDAGVLQLVDEEIHAKTGHYGGYSIWGRK